MDFETFIISKLEPRFIDTFLDQLYSKLIAAVLRF